MAKTPEIMSLDKLFIHNVNLRLQSFGYQVEKSDTWMIGFSIEKVVNYIKNECNVSIVPDGLKQVAIDMVCGEFLFAKKASGQLKGFDTDTEAVVKQIQEGDTNIVFAVGEGNMTPEQKLDGLITYLMENKKSQIVTYRRLKW